MNCIGFPKIFKANTTVINTGYDASNECLKLLLNSEQGDLFGDPQFGIKLKKYTYEQNNYILRDVLLDEICEKISIFCPQITVRRENISIQQDGTKLTAHIKALNKADFTTSTFDLVLLEEEER